MAVNPLVAAIAAFGQGEAQGRERKRKAERDWAADVDTFRQRERQGALDRAAQEFQQFQMQAPERAEQQRVKVQGELRAEQETERGRKQAERDALTKVLQDAQSPDPAISGPARARAAAYDPTYLDKFLTPAKVEEETFTGQPFEMGKDDKMEAGLYIRGSKGTVKRVGASPPAKESGGMTLFQSSRAEAGLAGRYQNNPLVKNAYGIANAIGPARVALQENSPLGDLMALYAIVKLYDPESVVREGEIKLAQSANSLPDAIRLLYLNTAKGRKVTPYYRQQIESMIGSMQKQKEAQIAPVQRQFGLEARQIGADSATVAPSPFEMTGLKKNKYLEP